MLKNYKYKCITNVAAKIIAIKWLIFKIGFMVTIFMLIDIMRKSPKEYKIKFNFQDKDVTLNLFSTRTDLAMLTEIFCFQAYEIRFEINPKLIIDAGSNKGLTTIYFGIKYPSADIHCYEPNIDLIRILEDHVRINNINATIFNKALSGKAGVKYFEKSDNHQYSKIVGNNSDYKVTAVTINEVYKKQKIDILKLDIEGEEESVINLMDFGSLDIRIIIQEVHYDRVDHEKIFSILKKNSYYFSEPYSQYYYLNPEVTRPILLAIKNCGESN